MGVTSEVIAPKDLAALNKRHYPGNVRDLERVVAELVAGGMATAAGCALEPKTP